MAKNNGGKIKIAILDVQPVNGIDPDSGHSRTEFEIKVSIRGIKKSITVPNDMGYKEMIDKIGAKAICWYMAHLAANNIKEKLGKVIEV